jgi:hypothetical protein
VEASRGPEHTQGPGPRGFLTLRPPAQPEAVTVTQSDRRRGGHPSWRRNPGRRGPAQTATVTLRRVHAPFVAEHLRREHFAWSRGLSGGLRQRK